MMRVAVLGGTFNPVHIGHLFLAEEVKIRFKYNKIIFVPAYIPPHKTFTDSIESKDRLSMLELALKTRDDFVIDTCEIERGGISYTIDTIRYVRDCYSLEGNPGFIIGDDLVEGFSQWKDTEKLIEITDIILAHRKTTSKKEFPWPHSYIENELLPISSSDIRTRIKEGRAFRYLVPESVYFYIMNNGVYE